MQREIRVIVAVNDEEHAETIKQEIMTTVQRRTTIYCVTRPFCSDDTVDSLHESEAKGKRK